MSFDPKLIHANYGDKEYLRLSLGRDGGKLVGLVSEAMSPEDVSAAKDRFSRPGSMDMRSAIGWIRDNLPQAYRDAYRSFKNGDLTIVKEYQIS